MDIHLARERAIPPGEVLRLYSFAGWWPNRTEADVEAVVGQGTAAGAWEGERLIGFARFLSDGCLRAYIEDVVVDPAHRNKGVATALLQRILDALGNVEVISLFSDEESAAIREQRLQAHAPGRNAQEPRAVVAACASVP